jgi:(p)ppGpp synthase/HD superfamily hydrolase
MPMPTLAEPIRKAEYLLEQHIPNPHIVRHAAEVQARLLSWNMGERVQVAALVMPLLAHGDINADELTLMFGRRTLQIARRALSFSVRRGGGTTDIAFAEKLRDLYLCAYIDAESALVCAADRIASISLLDRMDETLRTAWGAETLAVDVPFFEMLGMWKLYHSMANLALALTDNDRYLRYEGHVDAYYNHHNPAFQEIATAVDKAMGAANIPTQGLWMQEVTPGRLYERERRARMMGRRFDPANVGILHVDLIVLTEEDCYRALGVLHRLWMPSNTKPLQDNIAQPTFNGYRALTTTLRLPGDAVEFRIMTADMERVNAHGVTTWAVVSGAWWNDPALCDRVGIRDTTGLDEGICAFTPKGELVYPLRRGATLVDFAYKLHTDLAPYARKFIVNDVPQPFDYIIRHRDMIRVEYDFTHESLSPAWERAAKTRTARSHVRRRLRDGIPAADRGREAINRVLARESEIYNMRFTPSRVNEFLEKNAKSQGCSVVALYEQVAQGQLSPDEIVAEMIELDMQRHVRVLNPALAGRKPVLRFARSWMHAPQQEKWQRSSRIYPGVSIVGRLVERDSKVPLVIVHRTDSPEAPKGGVPLAWTADQTTGLTAVHVVVTSMRRRGVPLMVLNAVHEVANQTGELQLITRELQSSVQDGFTQLEMTVSDVSASYPDALRRQFQALQDEKKLRTFRLWQLFPGERVQLVGLTRQHQRNPFHLRHVSDMKMFYGREREIQTVVDYILDDVKFIIIHGHMRIGKTSLMHYLASYILPETTPHVLPVLYNTQDASPITEYTFVDSILAEATEVVAPLLRRRADREQLTSLHHNINRDAPLKTFVTWVQTAEQAIGRRLYFFIDEFTVMHEAHEKSKVSPAFFRQLHAIFDRGQVSMLLCIHDHVMRDLGERLLNASQRAEIVAIRELDEGAARSLIREPFEDVYDLSDGLEDLVMRLTNAHPYFVHILCGELFKQMQIQKGRNTTRITPAVLRQAVISVLDSAFHWFATYRSATDNLGMQTLNTIAQLCGTSNDRWAHIDDIREKVLRYQAHMDTTTKVDRIDVQRRLDDVYNRGIVIRRKNKQHKVEYKIAVGLMHSWLLEGTRQIPDYLDDRDRNTTGQK